MDDLEKIKLGVTKYLNLEGSLVDIARELHIDSKLINQELYKQGYILKGGASALQVINLKKACDEYISKINEGISITSVALKYNVSRGALSNRVKSRGYTVVNHQHELRFDESVFDSIDTEEKAYWLGFIFADGYIGSHENCKSKTFNFELSLKGSDMEHLKKFNTFMKHIKDNVKISEVKCSDKSYLRCRWSVHNKHLWYTLNSYGCTPRKSLTLKFPDESIFVESDKYSRKELIRHFIRGYFDGDGCLTWANTEHTIASISVTGTKEFLTSLQEHLNVNNLKMQTKDYSINTYTFSLGYNKAWNITHYLYNNSTIYLDRKYNIYLEYCRLYKGLYGSLQTNIGEGCDANTEISTEIKESVPSYSVETETV